MTTCTLPSKERPEPAARGQQDIGLLAASALGPTHLLGLIVALFIVLGVVYSLATPVLEASDEFKHYPYVQYVQSHRALPILEPETCQDDPEACPWLQDGGQPPAYYVLMAAATSWIDTSDLQELLWRNNHAFIGNPTQVCNKNLIIHRPQQEAFPWTGSVLAVHVVRLLTLLFGAGTVLLTYLLARSLMHGHPGLALGASALTAFNPMFLFVSASVNNDAMAAFIGSCVLLLLVRTVDWRPSEIRMRLIQQSVLLGLLLGLGVLTKLSLLGLIPVALLVVAIRGWQADGGDPPLRRATTAAVYPCLILIIAASVSGWWFLRNWRLYGDPTGLDAFIAVQGRRAHPPTLQDWIGEFGTFRWTYWGLFGGVNVMAPQSVYWFFDLLSVVSLLGLGIRAIRHWQRGLRTPDYQWLIPLAWALILFVSVLRWTWISPAFQGRLVFPGIAGISLLMALGLHEWSPPRWRPLVSVAVAATLLIVAALLPFVSIKPAYAQPKPLQASDLPESARVPAVDIGGVARVVGVELDPQSIAPEDDHAFIDAVIYWEALEPDDRDYVSFARLLGRDHKLVGHVNRHPGCGMVPTSLWQPGEVWRDPYHIPVSTDAQAPSRLRIEVGLYDPQGGKTLGATHIGDAKLAAPESAPTMGSSLEAEFSDGVTLLGYDIAPAAVMPGETMTVTLYWQARTAPSGDYQVFVHLLGDDSHPLAQGDSPPVMGDYPTSLWADGEIIADPHPVALPPDLPAGDYRLLVGMYNLETMQRLSRLGVGESEAEIPVTVGGE